MFGSTPTIVTVISQLTFGDEQLHHVCKALSRGNVQTSKPVLILDCWVRTKLNEHFNHVKHVFLNGLVHWGIKPYFLMVLEIRISLVLKKSFYHG